MDKEIDLNALVNKVSGIQNPLEAVAKKAFEDFMFRFQQEGTLKDGKLNLDDLDISEKEEFIKLVGQFDKQFFGMMMQSIDC